MRRLVSSFAIAAALVTCAPVASSICTLPLFAPAVQVHAQGKSENVKGTVFGPDNKPLPKQSVVLHRVMGSTGLTVATATSDDKGNFVLHVPDPSKEPDAVYFLAARYNADGELYIGDAFKAPFDTTEEHRVQVGTPETSARSLVASANADGSGTSNPIQSGPPPKDPTQWLMYILPALALIALAIMTMGRRAHVPARRRTLAAIARLDEAHASTPGDTETYRAQRSTLLDQLGRAAQS